MLLSQVDTTIIMINICLKTITYFAFSEIDSISLRAVVKYVILKGKNIPEIYENVGDISRKDIL